MRKNGEVVRHLIPAAYQRLLRSFGVQRKLPERQLPTVEVNDVVIDDIDTKILQPVPAATGGNISALEVVILAKIAHLVQAQVVFEIGTFDGRSTLNLAANSSDDVVVYTLDLPQEQLASTKFAVGRDELNYVKKAREEVGHRFANSPYREKIVQLWGDSATFDFSPYYQKADLVFVDGSHAYEYVHNDSKVALALLRPGAGLILWHDYDWGYGGTAKALEELSRTPEYRGLKHIEETCLAYMSRIPPAHVTAWETSHQRKFSGSREVVRFPSALCS